MSEIDIRSIFKTEAKEIIENLESDVVRLEESSEDEKIINRIFRYFHTLKGSSGIAGLTHVYEFSHLLENLLDDVRSGHVEVTDSLIDLIFDSIDWMKGAIFSEDGTEVSENNREKLSSRIYAFTAGGREVITKETDEIKIAREPVESGAKYYNIKAFFKEDIFESGIDPLMIIEDLMSMGRVVSNRVIKKKLPSFESMDPECCYFGWEIVLETESAVTEIKDVFLFVEEENNITIEDETSNYRNKGSEEKLPLEKKIGEIMVDKGILTDKELNEVVTIQDKEGDRIGDIVVKKGYATKDDVNIALIEQERLKKKIELQTVRVDTIKLDNLLNLLGEIVIGQSTLTRIADEIDNEYGDELKRALYGINRTTREFQEQIMSIRMIPIGPTFNQFRRFVRDSAHLLGKEIKLIIEGGETELDKTVIEKIGDPLKHMIRNSIDHGIEPPEERVAAGKNRSGEIILRAYHQEGNVFIEIVDDGRGIDIEKVREKAIHLKYIEPDEEIAREKLLSFLFMPGFSTAEKVGDLSGRGVGMDVVKTNIDSLRGSVEIKSEKGSGSTVKIKLPLTLAIIDSMLVRIGKNRYIIPLLSVVETIRPAKDDIKTIEGKGEVLLYRGEFITLVRLYDVLGIDAEYHNPWEALVVIAESEDRRLGLLIDDMPGQQQIVIKSLDNYITKSRAISGASILGDGTVALIIDIFGLIEELGG